MKKLVTAVVVVLLLVVGLWAGATAWFGIRAEKHYMALLDQASQSQMVTFRNQDYHRGFLHSTAVTIMSIKPPAAAGTGEIPVQITLTHEITHGPFPIGKDGASPFVPVLAIIETGVKATPETQDWLGKLYAQVPELASTLDVTIIHINGSGDERFRIPAFQHTFGTEDKAAVDWKGVNLDIHFSSDFKDFSGAFSLPGLTVASNELNIKVGEIQSSFDFREGLAGLSLGPATLQVSSVELSEKKAEGPGSLALKHVSAESTSKAVGDNLEVGLTFQGEQLKIDEQTYGPAVFAMEFRRFDAASLAKMQQAAREVQAQAGQMNPQAVQMMMLARYGQILPALLKKSPEIEITQLNVKTPDGDLSGKAKLACDGSKVQAALDIPTLINALSAQADFSAAEALLRRMVALNLREAVAEQGQSSNATDAQIDAQAAAQADQQLQALVTQGFLVKEGNTYKASASYGAGQALLNGKPVPIPGMN